MSAPGFPDNLPAEWRKRLAAEADAPYFRSLVEFLRDETRARRQVFPAREHVLRALSSLDLPKVRVVILGQDPYHGPGQAIGLSFAVPNGFPRPPSLLNIFKELESDLGVRVPADRSDLSGWVEQGVLLLNTVLTVRAHQALSHRDRGWEKFTDRVIEELNARPEPMVFVLWGASAQKKKALFTNPAHRFIESPHPSPLSAHRGFFGSRPFSRVNAILEELGRQPIDWSRVSA